MGPVIDCPARFFLAGGVFKSLLHGRPPHDLDIWAPSPGDRDALVDTLLQRGAVRLPESPYVDRFEVGGQVVEVKMYTNHAALEDTLEGFDLLLSAVGAQHLGGDRWRAVIHPDAMSSYRAGEVLLQRPTRNWRHSLASLVRLRKYADELGLVVPDSKPAHIWDIL